MEAQLRHCPDSRISVPAAAITECVPAHWTASLHGWLALVRPPNLFTVPGDVLAGAALAGIGARNASLLVPAVFASLLLYVSGLILNDYMDRHIDARERPERPIPSGRVSAAHACAASVVLMGAAIVLSLLTGVTLFWVMTCVLSGLIVLYNGPARRIPLAGFAVMGLCRGANVFLGASVAGALASSPVLVGAGLETLYIFCVTLLAHGEVDKLPAQWQWSLPPAVVLAASPILFLCRRTIPATVIIPLMILLGWLATALAGSTPRREETPKKIGALIRGLILLQILLVVFCLSRNPAWFSLSAVGLLVLMSIAAEGTATRFHGS
jgi:hypothetical protein